MTAKRYGQELMRKCRVLHVLPDLQMGGGQQVLLRNIAYADRESFEHHVVYFLPHHDLAPRFHAVGVEPLYLAHGTINSWQATLRSVVRLIKDRGINLVHINGTPLDKLYGQLAALRCRIPVVSTLHGPRFRPGALRSIVRNGIRELLEYVLEPATTKAYVAVSEAVRDSWCPYIRSRGVGRQPMTVIPNGVPIQNGCSNDDRSRLTGLRSELGLKEGSPVLINIGRLDPRKGQRFLMPILADVLKKQADAVLVLGGDGPDREPLERLAHELGVTRAVRFLGQREDVPDLLRIADVFVFPSLGEGMPLAVLEAMAAAKPVVAFVLPGLDDLVKDGATGRLVAMGEAADFTAAVLGLLADPQEACRLGVNGQALIRDRFSIETSARKLEKVYTSVLAQCCRS